MIYLIGDVRAENFVGYTLVLPAISVGNVGQLAVDMLVCGTRARKVGYVHGAGVVPVCGGDPYAEGEPRGAGPLCVACEIFATDAPVDAQSAVDPRLVIVQLRAPLVRHRRKEFVKELLDWARSTGFKRIVMLTSSLAHERVGRQLDPGSDNFRFLCTSIEPKSPADGERGRLYPDGWLPLEGRPLFPAPAAGDRPAETVDAGATSGQPRSLDPTHVYIPGGGISKKFYQRCEEAGIPLTILMVFCAEGDNRREAFLLVDHLDEWLPVRGNPKGGSEERASAIWKPPPSWKLLFGGRPPSLVY